MPNIIHRVGIQSKTHDVYKALSTLEGLSNWWTRDVTGSTQLDGEIIFTFKTPTGDTKGKMKMKVLESESGKHVEWVCLDGPSEWVGTHISFDLTQEAEFATVIFRHSHWKEEVDFMGHCSMKWATFLLSLREYVEKGKGLPSPQDLKIDNWN